MSSFSPRACYMFALIISIPRFSSLPSQMLSYGLDRAGLGLGRQKKEAPSVASFCLGFKPQLGSSSLPRG